jgi:type IX secretion system PorP/SprF family membrane protein
MYLKPLSGGVALTIQGSSVGGNALSNTGLGLAYAQHFQLPGGKSKLIPSAQVFYSKVKMDYGQFSPGGAFIWNQPGPVTKKGQYFDANAGLLFTHDDRLFLGVSVFHLNSPRADLGYDYSLSPRYSFYGSYNFFMGEKSVLQCMYSLNEQQHFTVSQLGVNMLLSNHWLLGSAWTSAQDVFLNAGYKTKTLVLCFSWDITMSKLAGNTAGSYEIHASYNLRSLEKRNTRTSFERL